MINIIFINGFIMKLINLLEQSYIDPKFGLDIKDFTSGNITYIRCFSDKSTMALEAPSPYRSEYQTYTVENTFDCVPTHHFPFDFSSVSLPNLSLQIFDCFQLETLKGCPNQLGHLQVSGSKISSLEYAPLKCDSIILNNSPIKELKGIGRNFLKDVKIISIELPLESNVLGLCRIKNLRHINNQSSDKIIFDVLNIVNKHLKTDGSECQEELIQNGFNDYAKF
jgi:hypothetical protein